jgi:tetratricopeptide (TPR) repeat protein
VRLAALSDRFLLQGLAGSGGMGSVYRALDRRTGARVAVKVVAAEGPGVAARFAMEAEALAALEHPAIVRFVAFGTDPGATPFLAMEWIDGEDLAARLERGRLSPRQVVELGRRVAEALAAAHARGIVHRDIKPHNLLLPGGQIERVKVVDFGVARIRSARGLTPNDALVGTPGYMAPEQARGARDIDARADLFSLGAVMFECLTGRQAFRGEHTMAVLAKLLLDDPLHVGALRPDVPPALAHLVDRMLAKDRDERPRHAEAVVAALEGIARTLESDAELAPQNITEPPPPRALTGSEQRLVSVVAVRTGERWVDPDAIGSEARTLTDAPGAAALRDLRDALEPLGARIDPLVDGSILATWMSADAPADQAARAARGALLAQRLVPGAAIAIASGLSDVSQPRAVGQVLDRAAQLLAAAAPATGAMIRLDPVVAGLLDVRFQVAQTAAAFELLGEEDIGRAARTLLGRPTPCVGRERELRELGDLLDECVAESAARAVLVTAPAGTGKSRLRYELLRGPAARAGVEVWQARGDPMIAGSAFASLASAIRGTADVPGGAPLHVRAERLRARVARHVPAGERDRVATFLGEMIGTPFPDDFSPLLRPARRSAVAMVDQIRRALLDFVAAECAAHPLLLVLEDLHWGDSSSVALLDATLDRLSERPLMVLALGRPETRDVFPDLWARRRMREIRLDGLSRRAATELVVHVLGASVDGARVAELVDRAEGNAFYLEEMIRTVAEGRGGALPETVLAMVQARLDALPSEPRRVLRAASVFGEAFWPGGLAALLGDGDGADAIDEHLDALVEREILVRRERSRFPGEPELSFRHALLRDGAYALLTEGDRALGHHLAAEWLERMGGADARVLAEHFERAKEPERAAAYHLLAAERALGSDMQAAIACAERVSAVSAPFALRLRRAKVLVEARWFTGALELADGHADEILALAKGGVEFWSGLGVKLMLAAELGSAERLLSAMQKLASAEVTPETQRYLMDAHAILVLVFVMSGPRELAAHHMERVEQLGAGLPPDAIHQHWYLHTARGQWRFVFEADFWAARAAFQESLAWAERTGDSRWTAYSHALLGWIDNVLGDFERSERSCRVAIATSHRTGQAGLVGRIVLSWTCSMRGRLDDAEAAARSAIENARGNGYGEGLGRTALGYALLRRGELTAAERETRAALALLETTPLLRTIVVASLAEIHVEQGRFREALALAREALGPEGRCHVYPSSESCARLAEVRALSAAGDEDGARAALAVARDRLLSQAAGIPEGEAREMFLKKPPWNDRILALAAERLS